MLKVIGSEVCQNTEIEFGDYLPFQFWHQPRRAGAHLYWRTGDLQSTLIEVEIDQADGKIVGVSLLLPGPIIDNFPVLDRLGKPELKGYPLVVVNDWPDNRVKDEPNLLQVFSDTSRLLILFSDSVTISKIIVSQNLTFGVDTNDFLAWILVEELQTENVVSFKNLRK